MCVRVSDRLVVRVRVIYHHQDVAPQLEHLLPWGRADWNDVHVGGALGGRGWGGRLKGQSHEIFDFRFFLESVSPQH